jgi:hypothetical protein
MSERDGGWGHSNEQILYELYMVERKRKSWKDRLEGGTKAALLFFNNKKIY